MRFAGPRDPRICGRWWNGALTSCRALRTAQPALTRALPIVLVIGAPWTSAHAGVAEQYDCRRDETLRRIEVQVSDRPSRLPCEVVYWKGGTSSVLWEADNQLDFCTARASELASRLEEAGWTCTLQGESPATEPPALEPPRREEPPPENAAPRAPVPETRPSGFSRAIEPSVGEPERVVLEAALDRDLDRLSTLTPSGDFRIEAVSLGDIDRNGLEDAVVLMTYGRDGSSRDPYLVAYLFDGETFRATAQVRVGQSVAELESAELQGIEQGKIGVVLNFRVSGDPGCCPSGRRLLSFVLRDGALVEQPGTGNGA
jgi:hypothetical protein